MTTEVLESGLDSNLISLKYLNLLVVTDLHLILSSPLMKRVSMTHIIY